MKTLFVLVAALTSALPAFAAAPRVLKAGDYYVVCEQANAGESPAATTQLNTLLAAPSVKNSDAEIDKPYTVVNLTMTSAGDNQTGIVWDACALIRKD